MVMISPQIATTKPAPATSRTSRTGTMWPVGAPSRSGSVGEAILRLGHADRQLAVAGGLDRWSSVAALPVGDDVGGAVDRGGDGADLVGERHVVGVERREAGARRADRSATDDAAASSSAPAPPSAQWRQTTASTPNCALADRRRGGVLGLGVGGELVDRDDHRHAEPARRSRRGGRGWRSRARAPRGSRVPRSAFGDAAVHLERAHGRDDHRRAGVEAGLAALDVEELLGAEVGAEAGLGDDVVAELERRRGSRSPSCSRARCWRTGRRGRAPGVPSSVCTRFGWIASLSSTVIAPAALHRRAAVTGVPSRV